MLVTNVTLLIVFCWAGISTPIGPVYVGYGRAEGGADAFYVSLGRVF